MFFGIDLTFNERKPSACVCLNTTPVVVYNGLLAADEDIIAELNRYSPAIITIDAPLSIPVNYCCLDESCRCHLEVPEKGRLCERELARLGIPCYFTTKRSIIKEMVERAIKLKGALEGLGYSVIEVYPYASKVHLFRKPIPRKTTVEGLTWLKERVRLLVDSPELDSWSHDLCDAAIAAYTGLLYALGDVIAVGDVGEGLIYLPKSSFYQKEIY